MSNINYVRSLLKKFEENRYKEEGTSILEQALEEITNLSDEASAESEIVFCRNAVQTYRTLIIEMAKVHESNGTSSFAELNHTIDLLMAFKKYGLDEDSSFLKTLAKIMVLYIEAFRREFSLNRLTEDERNEIYNTIICKSQGPSGQSGWLG